MTENASFLTVLFGIDVPVAQGAGRALVRPSGRLPVCVHGRDGLGEVERPSIQLRPLDPRPAHVLIRDVLRAHPGEVTVIAVGRLTNLALLLLHDPEASALAKSIMVMDGAFGLDGPNGNVTPLAEANIIGDPHAADQVFMADWPVTVVGLDITRQIRLSRSWISAMAASADPSSRFVGQAKELYVNHHSRFGIEGCYVHDSSAVACALIPEAFSFARGKLHVITEGIALGQTVIVPENHPGLDAWPRRRSQAVATSVDTNSIGVLLNRIAG